MIPLADQPHLKSRTKHSCWPSQTSSKFRSGSTPPQHRTEFPSHVFRGTIGTRHHRPWTQWKTSKGLPMIRDSLHCGEGESLLTNWDVSLQGFGVSRLLELAPTSIPRVSERGLVRRLESIPELNRVPRLSIVTTGLEERRRTFACGPLLNPHVDLPIRVQNSSYPRDLMRLDRVSDSLPGERRKEYRWLARTEEERRGH